MAGKMAGKALGVILAGAVCLSGAVDTAAMSPIIDGARTFGSGELSRLEENLNRFEKETSFHVRVLTRDARRAEQAVSGETIKKEWNLPDERAIIVVIDADKGNVLRFNVGKEVHAILPDQFFGELQGRFGNLYTVQKEGEDGVVIDAITVVEKCIKKGGCRVVPGIGEDQYTATLACSSGAGFVFGFTLLTTLKELQNKKDGTAGSRDDVWKYSPLLFAPLWGSFLGLGINPLLARQAEPQLLYQNLGAFAGVAAVVAVLGPLISSSSGPPSDGEGGGGGGQREGDLIYQTVTIDRENDS